MFTLDVNISYVNNTQTDIQIYNSTHYVLAGFYFVLSVVTICLALYKAYAGTLKETWKGFFFLFVILGSTLRGVWALFDPMMLSGVISITNQLDIFLNLFPSILFFSNYLILLFMWVEIYHFPVRAGMRIHHLRAPLWIVMGLMFACFVLLFVLDIVLFPAVDVPISSPSNIVERMMVLMIATLYFLTCIAFSVYGLLVVVPLWRNSHMQNPKARQMLLRLLALTMLIMVIFLIRAAMVFIGYFQNWSFWAFFDLVYYTGCEILPIYLMLFILMYRPPASSSTKQQNSGGHTNKSDERAPLN